MNICFAGEPDDRISPSSQMAAMLAARGANVRFDEAPCWRSAAWSAVCRDCDVVHVTTYGQLHWMLLRKIWRARHAGLPVVRTWVGSDVLWALQHAPSRRFARALVRLSVVQHAVSETLIDELRTIGVTADRVPVMCPNLRVCETPPAMPDRFVALCYLPSRRRTFYGGPIIDALIRALPDVTFRILGDADHDYHNHANVESLGRVADVQPVITTSSAVIRPTMHDGMPRLVLEMLANGRHAITWQPLPHCRHVQSFDEAKRALQQLQVDCPVNTVGARYVARQFDPTSAADEIAARFQRLLSSDRRLLRRRGLRRAWLTTARCPWIFSRRCESWPDASTLPTDPAAAAFRQLIQPVQPSTGVAVA